MTANTTASRKQKGRGLQKTVRDSILSAFPNLTDRDVHSRSMGAQGTDVYFSEAGYKDVPLSIECKFQESLNIWSALQQSEENVDDQHSIPVVVFKRSRSDTYVALHWDDLLALLRELKHYKETV